MTSSPRLLMPEAPEEILANSSAEGCPPTVIEPISSSVVGSMSFFHGKESIERSGSGQQCCFKQSVAPPETNVQDEAMSLDDCPRTDLHDSVMCFTVETQGETPVATGERGPLNCEFRNELENVSAIESRVSKIRLAEAECKSDSNECHLGSEGASLNNAASSGAGVFKNSPGGIQMASEVLLVSGASSGSTPEKESNCYGSSGNTSVGRQVEAAVQKSNSLSMHDKPYSQVLHSQLSPMFLDLALSNDSCANSTLQCKERHPECNNGPSIEKDSEISEQKCDVSSSMQLTSCKTILSAVENSLQEGSSSVAPKPVVEKSIKQSIPLHQCLASTNENNGNMAGPHASIFYGLQVADAAAGVADIACHAYYVGDDHSRVADACEANFPGVQSFSLRRSSRVKKYVQKTERTKSSRKCIKKVITMPLLGGTTDLLLKAARRKRSFLSQSIRSSGWGLVTNLTKYFGQTNGVRPQKVKGRQRRRKQNKFHDSMSSRGSKGAKCVPSGPIRLKVIFGKEAEQNTPKVMPSVGAEALVIDCSRSSDDQPFGKCEVSIDKEDGNKMHMIAPFFCSNKNLGASEKYPAVNVHPVNRDSEICFISDKAAGNCCGNSAQMEVEKSECSNGDRHLDPGTSPDSEVINQVPDSQKGARAFEIIHDPAINSSRAITCPGNVNGPPSSGKSTKRGKKKDKLSQVSNEDRLLHPAKMDKAKTSKKSGLQQKIDHCICSRDSCISVTSGIASSNGSDSEHITTELLPVTNKEPHEALKLDNDIESNVDCGVDAGLESAESWNSKKLLQPTDAQGHKNPKGSNSKGRSHSKSRISDAVKSHAENSHRSKVDSRTFASESVVNENETSEKVYKIWSQIETGEHGMDGKAKIDSVGEAALVDASFQDVVLNGGSGDRVQTLRPRSAWVCCDACEQWRCIPAALADIIDETNCKWTCKDNQDKAFADCSIPQEKSNAEINAELEISDEEDAHDAVGLRTYTRRNSSVPQQSFWMLIKSNLFLSRSRKTQTMDEIMVCHCKFPREGRLGCGDECLNRMLNIECVRGTCPCGDLCSNQQFQRRNYAKLKWFRCGKKGYGLQVLEDISQGQFLIEYVGEVLDLQSYEARQREYASKGHKHFYFMTLNGSEVIDACAKGNLGRFINHSCDPNCRTEKWMVNGEICIGIFAVRNIKKGEELTFDYNYVRVFGAAAKKCYCGATQCRGYIGGDPLNAEVIVQGDSDDEYPEPVVLNENGEIDSRLGSATADSVPDKTMGILSEDKDIPREDKSITEGSGQLVMAAKKDLLNESVVDLLTWNGSSETLETLQLEDAFDKPPPPGQQVISTEREVICTSSLSTQKSDSSSLDIVPSKILSGSVDASRRSESEMAEGKCVHSKSRLRMKISHSSKSIKIHKSDSSSVNAEKAPMATHINKQFVVSHKPKKLLEGSANGHLEEVEEKLNDLLDADGGICKRKDASRGYLKLLLLTAASGDNGHGGTIQSNRDLSMILDAILKTKSRGVLVDIINKNGLQMLHNMMKQYRWDFKKIPILRKLLKVFEFLAEKGILTGERINADPPCPGVESFRESILTFTEHEDKKVHQIARNFRDKWIPRVRKFNCMEKGDRRMDINSGSNSNRFMGSYNCWRDQGARPSEAIDCTKLSLLSNDPPDTRIVEGSSQVSFLVSTTGGTRKRKSRWDQPADQKSPRPSKEQKSLPDLQENCDSSPHCEIGEARFTQINGARQEKSCTDAVPNCSKQIRCCTEDVEWQELEKDAPPGFSSPPPGFSSPPGSSSPPPGFSPPPPGFSSPLGGSQVQCTACDLQKTDCQQRPSEVSMGHPQKRYSSGLPVAYGIPFCAIQQFRARQAAQVDGWIVAPGIPFHPFPPLPPYPRQFDKRDSQGTRASSNKMIIEGTGQVKDCCRYPAPCHTDQGMPSTSCESFPDGGAVCANFQHIHQRDRGLSYHPGRRYFRQQKWSNSKFTPPWLFRRSGRGFNGSNYPRNGAFGVGTLPNVRNDQRSEVVNLSVDCALNP